MPLKKGKSRKVQSQNIREMMHSKTFAKGKSAEKRLDMAVAASYRQRRSGKR